MIGCYRPKEILKKNPSAKIRLLEEPYHYEIFGLMNPFLRSWTLPQRIVAVIVGVVLVALTYACWQYWLYKGGIFQTSNFDETKWKELNLRTGDSSCYRGGMASDMQINILYPGLPKAQVETLLGTPDFKRVGVYEYSLGMCSRLRMDLDTLDVHFNADDKIEKVLVVQH